MTDLESVKKLRSLTGAGFKDCNNALKESAGKIEKAVEILRVKGISKASKKMERDANEGLISITGDEKKSSIIEINCETDFVAKNDDFINFVKEISELNHKVNSDENELNNQKMNNRLTVKDNLINLISKIGEKITIGRKKTIEFKHSKNYIYRHTIVKDNLSKLGVILSLETNNKSSEIDNFGKQLSMHIAASNPVALNKENLPTEIVKKEQELIEEELKNSGKPDDIIKKISVGKLNKFKEDSSLLTQDWVIDPKKKVFQILEDLKDSKVKINSFYRIKIGD